MKYIADIEASINSPDRLEELYQNARAANDEDGFRSDMQVLYDKSPDNILLSAWHSRFEHFPPPKPKRVTNWALAVLFGILTGLILWAVSDPTWLFLNQIPYIVLLWAPIAAIPAMIFLSIASKKNYLYTTISAISLIVVCIYILLISPRLSHSTAKDYLTLMVLQLPLLCWIGLGIAVLKLKSTTSNRFAFLIKSIEVMITAGVYLIFGVAFGLITLGMFAALNINLPQLVMRLIAAGGFGLIPILAVATMYDPHVSPEAQDFDQGLSKFVITIMRLLLPLTLFVLVIYLFVIPFSFTAPFQNRNLLIVYNVMQFAIIGLLIGATPLKLDDIATKMQVWLRRGIIAVSVLALIISLYALSAVIYRTVLDGVTLNRFTIIGWNIINIAILGAVIYTQFARSSSAWHEWLQNVFSKATTAYLIWSVFLIMALPLLFK